MISKIPSCKTKNTSNMLLAVAIYHAHGEEQFNRKEFCEDAGRILEENKGGSIDSQLRYMTENGLIENTDRGHCRLSVDGLRTILWIQQLAGIVDRADENRENMELTGGIVA